MSTSMIQAQQASISSNDKTPPPPAGDLKWPSNDLPRLGVSASVSIKIGILGVQGVSESTQAIHIHSTPQAITREGWSWRWRSRVLAKSMHFQQYFTDASPHVDHYTSQSACLFNHQGDKRSWWDGIHQFPARKPTPMHSLRLGLLLMQETTQPDAAGDRRRQRCSSSTKCWFSS